ncbi:MAG TPA: MiaB/RimO family radical SAM methylthiotransferase, partial [Chlamydiales bacterium]|nr:MiaB/RimO family radical SAM methylthiotransferase [Chlamydiales bacterium]
MTFKEAKKNFKIFTFGCRANQYESQAIKDQFRYLGWRESEEAIDIAIINACAVTEKAMKSSIAQLKKIRRLHHQAKLVMMGCIPDQNLEKLKKQFDDILFLKNEQKAEVMEILFPEKSEYPRFEIQDFDGHTRAFVKVQDGCNRFCSYCIIPFLRGRSISRSKKDILHEVEGLSKKGFKEIVLTGINLGDYHTDEDDLTSLIQAVCGIEGIERIRLSSIDPEDITEGLLDVYLQNEKCMPSFHISMQSGSDRILKEMRRNYTTKVF